MDFQISRRDMLKMAGCAMTAYAIGQFFQLQELLKQPQVMIPSCSTANRFL